MRSLFAVILVISSLNVSASGELEEAIRKMNIKYKEAKSFRMDITVKMLNDDNKLIETETGLVKKEGRNYYTKYENQETLVNSKCKVSVDHDGKKMIYSLVLPAERINDSEFEEMLEQITTSENYTLIKKDAYGYHIRVLEAGYYYEDVRLLISPDFLLKKVTYNYKENENQPYSKMIISYSNIQMNIDLDDAAFSEKKFIRNIENQARPAKRYAGYTLVKN